MKPAGGWLRSPASDRSQRLPSSRQSAAEQHLKRGRGFAAWLGLVPGEYTTGGKQRLLGISKRGNSYLRRLFIQGAHAVLQQRTKQSFALSAWLAQLTSRAHRKVVVALANKLARVAWAVLATNQQYRPRALATSYDHTTGLQMTPA